MSNPSIPRWLEWAREIQALAQTGASYAMNQWQSQRYQRLMKIAAEIISEHTDNPIEPIYESFKVQPGYATPKVDVRGAIFRDGKLLMVRERLDDAWTIPGGWADVGDSPAAAVEREVWEESGFRVKAQKLIGIYDANRIEPLALYHAVKIFFLCDILDGKATPSDETSEIGFFAETDLPANLSTERTGLRHIRDAFASIADDSLPTIFE